jgi:hypothetical protein
MQPPALTGHLHDTRIHFAAPKNFVIPNEVRNLLS